MEIDNILDIKRKNLKSVIDFARFRDGWQKRDAARTLNLSFATVSNMINLLLEYGLLEQTQINLKAIGRSPKGYRLVPDRFAMVAMDVHIPEETVLSLINLRHEIIAVHMCKNMNTQNIEGFIRNLKSEYIAMLKEANLSEGRIIGATAIIPGMYNTRNQMVIGTQNRLFQHQPLREMLCNAMGFPVYLENDANLAAFSKAQTTNLQYLLYLYCGTGVGMGAVSEGNILRGADGFSVEISHAPFGKLGRTCPFCGHIDCLQEDVSPIGFVSKYKGFVIPRESYTREMWKAFLFAIEQGDPLAIEAALDNARVLGRALSTACSILRPETVVIGGLTRPLFDVMQGTIEEEINSRERYHTFIRVLFDNDFRKTAAIGGAEYIYRNWFPDLDWERKETGTFQ